jgi:60 kDa SS-A/Ro ribonucleoprotein
MPGTVPNSAGGHVCRKASLLPFGRTDCAQPIEYARRHRLEVDAFYVYTDSETWFGTIHPCQALQAYRRESGRAARSAVVAFVANAFSIADPNDAGMLDFAGLDASLPTLLGEFTRGGL